MTNPFIPLLQSYLPEPEASLMVGMLFGGKYGFPKEFYQALLTTGTIHIVALSGTNISIIVSLIAQTTYFLGRKLSSLISILGIILFILFVGPSATVVRAGIMGALTMLSVYFGRQSYILLSLFITGVLMVIVSPEVLSDLSFQLSFLATLGIIVFTPQARKATREKSGSLINSVYLKVKKIFQDDLQTTLAAQVATLPVIVFTFGRISLVAPLTNVLVGWTIFPLMVLGFSMCIVGIICYPIGQVIAWMAYVLLYYFVKIVEITGGIPYASLILK